QKKVEENHFGTRKRLLEYDDVMNKQRTVVYEKRRHALVGERIGMDIANMIWDRVAASVENCADYESLQMEALRVLAIELPFTEEEYTAMKPDQVSDRLFAAAMDNFKRKTDRMAQIVTPVIKRVYEEQGDRFENILIPITDGRRMYQIPCNLKDAYETEGKSVVTSFQKAILLHTIDECWKENLRELDELKHSVQNASYEQKDPLLIFKLESVNLFDNMVNKMNDQTVTILMRGQVPEPDPERVREAPAENRQQRRQYNESKADLTDPNQRSAAGRDTRQQVREPIRVEKTPGRNDPCPCGSGLKFKNCHGRNM
ncbi:MAG: SEC-C domain-containing protein, partial [Bacteroidaceae bacterium]|nr:SEC-C domain-containing protein [Bacteroidaceae bacterium]